MRVGVGERIRSRLRSSGVGTVFALGVVLLFLAIWGHVLAGTRLLVGADALYGFAPWNGSPGAHSPRNWLVLDAVREFVPWLGLIRHALGSGNLPLWDAQAMSGKPLLADYVSAVFSPFTLIAAAIGGPYGYSISMLVKIWVAGLGMLVYLRLMGVRPIAAGVGAVSFATCSYVVVWMAWPQSSVAAFAPWTFGAVELYFRRRGLAAFAAVATAIALVLVAGHPESSLVLAEGLVLYAASRSLEGRQLHLTPLLGLALAAMLGIAAAAVQLFPFVNELVGTSLGSFHTGAGLIHLDLSALSSWLVPNLHGNPGIDGQLGRPPHYNASTGFAGVAAVVVAVAGLLTRWPWDSVRVGLLLIALFAGGMVYGPLTVVVGRLPVLNVTYSTYLLMLMCFAIAALAGLGMDALLDRPKRRSPAGIAGLLLGLAGLAATVALAGEFAVFGARMESYFGTLPAYLHSGWAFWALLGISSLAAAIGSMIGVGWGGGRPALGSILILVLIEAGVFAGPYQPQVPPAEVYPKSAVIAWLVAHAGSQRVTGVGTALIPETASFYGLSDVRAYDVVRPHGMTRYWSLADAGYYDDGLYSAFSSPDPDWLAAAGVAYVLTPANKPIPGTNAVFTAEGVTVNAIHDPRPLVFAAPSVDCVATEDAAAQALHANGPLAAVVLQTATCPATSAASLTISSPRPEQIDVRVSARAPTVVVVLQSNTKDWGSAIDGKPAPVMSANLQYQAVAVPAGDHLLSLNYNPGSVRLGGSLSAIAVTLIVALFAVAACRRRSAKGVSDSHPKGSARLPVT